MDGSGWQKIAVALLTAAIIGLATQILKIPVLEYKVDELKQSIEENWKRDLQRDKPK